MTREQDRVLERSIIAVGAQRSGTTFLGGLLAAHPDLAYTGEPRFTWKHGNERESDALRTDDASPRVRQYIRVGFIEEVLPGCRFVHISRNGIDSVLFVEAVRRPNLRLPKERRRSAASRKERKSNG